MRCSIIFMLCCSWSLTFGQKWTIGVAASPDITYRWLPKGIYIGGQFKIGNQPISGFHTNASISYNFNESMSAGTELRYSFMGFRSVKHSYESSDPIETEWQSRRIYHFNFIEIPLVFNYKLGSGRFSWISSVFVSPALMFRYHRFLRVYPPGKNFESTEVDYWGTRFNIFCGLRSGIEYELNDLFRLRIQPEFKTGIRADLQGAHLWSLGLHVLN